MIITFLFPVVRNQLSGSVFYQFTKSKQPLFHLIKVSKTANSDYFKYYYIVSFPVTIIINTYIKRTGDLFKLHN